MPSWFAKSACQNCSSRWPLSPFGELAGVQAQQSANQDVVAALDWLKMHPKVDAGRIVASGCSSGGIQTLLTAQKGLGARASIAFAPAAESWSNGALDVMLEDAVSHARALVFILQAKIDFSTQPTEVLARIPHMPLYKCNRGQPPGCRLPPLSPSFKTT